MVDLNHFASISASRRIQSHTVSDNLCSLSVSERLHRRHLNQRRGNRLPSQSHRVALRPFAAAECHLRHRQSRRQRVDPLQSYTVQSKLHCIECVDLDTVGASRRCLQRPPPSTGWATITPSSHCTGNAAAFRVIGVSARSAIQSQGDLNRFKPICPNFNTLFFRKFLHSLSL